MNSSSELTAEPSLVTAYAMRPAWRLFLDQVIENMRQTGQHMQTRSKKTPRAGLGVNAVEC